MLRRTSALLVVVAAALALSPAAASALEIPVVGPQRAVGPLAPASDHGVWALAEPVGDGAYRTLLHVSPTGRTVSAHRFPRAARLVAVAAVPDGAWVADEGRRVLVRVTDDGARHDVPLGGRGPMRIAGVEGVSADDPRAWLAFRQAGRWVVASVDEHERVTRRRLALPRRATVPPDGRPPLAGGALLFGRAIAYRAAEPTPRWRPLPGGRRGTAMGAVSWGLTVVASDGAVLWVPDDSPAKVLGHAPRAAGYAVGGLNRRRVWVATSRGTVVSFAARGRLVRRNAVAGPTALRSDAWGHVWLATRRGVRRLVAVPGCEIPRVVGLTAADATARLRRAGCVADTGQLPDMGTGAPRVLAQLEEARTRPRGHPVALTTARVGGECVLGAGWEGVLRSDEVAIGVRPGPTAQLWACTASGRRLLVFEGDDPPWDVGTWATDLRLAGHWLVYVAHGGDRYGGGYSSIVRVDLRDRPVFSSVGGGSNAWAAYGIAAVAVNAHGDVAWADNDTSQRDGPATLHVRPDGGDERLLATGPTAAATDLAIDDTTVRWTYDGTPYAAPIAP
jgi:hypothetical protein